MVISVAIKSAEDSLRVKVRAAVRPDLRVLLSEVMVMEGATVSTVIDS